MKIVLTGGGSGGHFYPLIAVAEEIQKIVKEKQLVEAKIFYISDTPYNERLLFDRNIFFRKVQAGKPRRYFSIENFFDLFKTCWGFFAAFFQMFKIYPDVVFSKGAYASFPNLVAARFFKIPVVIHESDTVPGRTNLWSGKFAQRIALSYVEASSYFPKDKIAFTGNPVRSEFLEMMPVGDAYAHLKLSKDVPTIFIIGGSLGAEIINENILSVLPALVEKYQIIHQTGVKNFEIVSKTSNIILEKSEFKNRYLPLSYLDVKTERAAATISSLVISRAGSTIFEIAQWGIPSIIIPITNSNGDHQRKNAFAYGKTGAARIIEETNLKPHILFSQIKLILDDTLMQENMRKAAKSFAHPDAAHKIADEIISIALQHEK